MQIDYGVTAKEAQVASMSSVKNKIEGIIFRKYMVLLYNTS